MINKEFILANMYKDFISKYFIKTYNFEICQERETLIDLRKCKDDNIIHLILFNDCFMMSCYSCYDDCQVTSKTFYYKDYETLQKLTDLITDLENFYLIFNKYFNVEMSK